ncbi:MAG: Histidine kinase, partial [Devosia sp.]|uniref:sensor N-terminal transmembrane domain-containing protein n=1 Tax=Devosia sp. TaxID=1871048 RepID=UPI00262CE2C4
MAATDEPLPAAAPDTAPMGLLARLNRPAVVLGHWVLVAVQWVRRLLALTIFSSLARRIIVLNLAGLAVLVVGILFLN